MTTCVSCNNGKFTCGHCSGPQYCNQECAQRDWNTHKYQCIDGVVRTRNEWIYLQSSDTRVRVNREDAINESEALKLLIEDSPENQIIFDLSIPPNALKNIADIISDQTEETSSKKRTKSDDTDSENETVSGEEEEEEAAENTSTQRMVRKLKTIVKPGGVEYSELIHAMHYLKMNLINAKELWHPLVYFIFRASKMPVSYSDLLHARFNIPTFDECGANVHFRRDFENIAALAEDNETLFAYENINVEPIDCRNVVVSQKILFPLLQLHPDLWGYFLDALKPHIAGVLMYKFATLHPNIWIMVKNWKLSKISESNSNSFREMRPDVIFSIIANSWRWSSNNFNKKLVKENFALTDKDMQDIPHISKDRSNIYRPIDILVALVKKYGNSIDDVISGVNRRREKRTTKSSEGKKTTEKESELLLISENEAKDNAVLQIMKKRGFKGGELKIYGDSNLVQMFKKQAEQNPAFAKEPPEQIPAGTIPTTFLL